MPALGVDKTSNADQALQTIATQTLAAAPIVAPGQVTPAQQAELNSLQVAGTSALTQYYTGLGLNAASFNPGALVKSNILATQAAWSQNDTTEAIQALDLSSKDYNQYMEDQLKSNEQTQKELMIAASIAATIFTGGAAAPTIALAAENYQMSGSGGQSESQPGAELA